MNFTGREKGICYGNDAFPDPFNEAMANKSTQVFFGSDPAADYAGALWNDFYKSSTGSSCQNSMPPPPNACRHDLKNMADMGVKLIRLYDWDPRNNHLPFLDRCQSAGLKVLVNISNYFVQLPYEDKDPDKQKKKQQERNTQIAKLIESFSKTGDYHPVIEGILIGNELDRVARDDGAGPFNGDRFKFCVDFTKQFVKVERDRFTAHRQLRIGHPLTMGKPPAVKYPCWDVWHYLLPNISELKARLFLAPQTYNNANYLFKDAESLGKGYVDVTYDEHKIPIWFTEMGQDRTKNDFAKTVKDQLTGVLNYIKDQKEERLLGACLFSYVDKVWKQGTSEGSFGAHTHKERPPSNSCMITYSDKDFLHWDRGKDFGTLKLDHLDRTPLYDSVKIPYTTIN